MAANTEGGSASPDGLQLVGSTELEEGGATSLSAVAATSSTCDTVPLNPSETHARRRVTSVDVMRGFVVLLMAVDHVRERFFYHLNVSDPMDLQATWLVFWGFLGGFVCFWGRSK